MSKKTKMHTIHERKKNDNSFTIKGGYVPVKMDNIHEHLQETKRGCGVEASKKTYNRKKNNRIKESYDCSFFIVINKFIYLPLLYTSEELSRRFRTLSHP